MSTFKTSLKILWAHRVHIRRYLVLLSMFGLLAAGGILIARRRAA